MSLAKDAPYSEVTYKITSAALEVFHKLGPGHKETRQIQIQTCQVLNRFLYDSRSTIAVGGAASRQQRSPCSPH